MLRGLKNYTVRVARGRVVHGPGGILVCTIRPKINMEPENWNFFEKKGDSFCKKIMVQKNFRSMQNGAIIPTMIKIGNWLTQPVAKL